MPAFWLSVPPSWLSTVLLALSAALTLVVPPSLLMTVLAVVTPPSVVRPELLRSSTCKVDLVVKAPALSTLTELARSAPAKIRLPPLTVTMVVPLLAMNRPVLVPEPCELTSPELTVRLVSAFCAVMNNLPFQPLAPTFRLPLVHAPERVALSSVTPD